MNGAPTRGGKVIRIIRTALAAACIATAVLFFVQGATPSLSWDAGSGSPAPARSFYAAVLRDPAGFGFVDADDPMIVILSEDALRSGDTLRVRFEKEERDIPLDRLEYAPHVVAASIEEASFAQEALPFTGPVWQDLTIRLEGEDRMRVHAREPMTSRVISRYSVGPEGPVPISLRVYGPLQPGLFFGGAVMSVIGAMLLLLPAFGRKRKENGER